MDKMENEVESRLRPFYVLRLLYEMTDEEHDLTTNQIVDLLREKYGVRTQRTRIPQDIALLQEFYKDNDDVEIRADVVPGRPSRFCMLRRDFEPVEIKLLNDTVYSSLFLTEEKTEKLSGKLLGLLSVHEAEAIRETLVDNGRLKHDNEKIMYIVSCLQEAIMRKCQVAFQYFHYDFLKRRVPANDGLPYFVSPYALVSHEDNYYLIGFSEKHQEIVHFRVDRIDDPPDLLDAACVPPPEDFDLARYKSTMFRMYDSERVEVELACDESVMDSIVDRFGLDVDVVPINGHSFSVTAEVAVNHIFYSWIFGFGGKVKIRGPKEVTKGYAGMVFAAAKSFGPEKRKKQK